MKRIGVFIDVSNLYYCIQKKYPKRKLDYRKYKRFIEDLGEIQQAIAYGAQMAKQADGFKYCLQQMGFQTKYKTPKEYGSEELGIKRKADWDVGIAMDVVNMVDRFDMVILGTGDGDMMPLVEWCMQKGVDVVILATGISRDLRAGATKAIEIPESLLESNKPKGAIRPRELAEQKIKDGADPSSLHSISTTGEKVQNDSGASDASRTQDSMVETASGGDSHIPADPTPIHEDSSPRVDVLNDVQAL